MENLYARLLCAFGLWVVLAILSRSFFCHSCSRWFWQYDRRLAVCSRPGCKEIHPLCVSCNLKKGAEDCHGECPHQRLARLKAIRLAQT